MRHRIRGLSLFAVAVCVCGCDTRDDWFLEHGEEPVITMEASRDTLPAEEWFGKRYRKVSVSLGVADTLRFGIEDPYGKEIGYKMTVVNVEKGNYVFWAGSNISDAHSASYRDRPNLTTDDLNGLLRVRLDAEEKKIVFEAATNDEYGTTEEQGAYYAALLHTKWLYSGQPLEAESVLRIALTATNKIGRENTEYIQVCMKGNSMPMAKVSAECKDRVAREYTIKAVGTDADGHAITAYAYSFDTPIKNTVGLLTYAAYYEKEGTLVVNRDDDRAFIERLQKENATGTNGGWQFDADFILPTSRGEVSHVFQTAGEHTVYAIVRDEWGCWSDVASTKIIVE